MIQFEHIMQSTEYTYPLSNWNLKMHMDNKMKINRSEEAHCISVCTKFEESFKSISQNM